jgi:hypothetical protein
MPIFSTETYNIFSWLYVKFYSNSFFFLDYWIILQSISTIFLFFLVKSYKVSKPIIITIVLLTIWELIEFVAKQFVPPQFVSDSQIIHQLIDLIISVLTIFIFNYLFTKFKSHKYSSYLLRGLSSFINSFTIAFLWVGFYGYHYSQTEFNWSGLNWWAFFLWFVGANFIGTYFDLYRKKWSYLKSISIVYIFYLPILLFVEYLGRFVLYIQEVSNSAHKPLIFGLIYGNDILHFVYMSMPLIITTLFYLIKLMIGRIDK